MPAEALSKQARKRLAAVDQAYRSTLKSLHDEYNKHYDAMLRKHGLRVTTLMGHHSFPVEFHADLADKKRELIAGRTLALQARTSSARDLPRKRQRA